MMPSPQVNPLLAQAVGFHRSGRYREAIDLYERLLKQNPINPQVLDMLGVAYNSIGLSDEGRKRIEKAIKIAPGTAQFHHDLSLTFKKEGRFGKAHEALDKAIRLAPGEPSYKAGKAELHHMAGEFEAAMKVLDPVLGEVQRAPAVAIMFGTLAPRVGRQREAVQVLEQVLEKGPLIPAQRMKAMFTLGALYDNLDEFDKAFEVYRKANALNPLRYEAGLHQAMVDAAILNWSPDAATRLPTAKVDPGRLVFIVGMPRSGTTLVEQILSASPEVLAAGELNDIPRVARVAQSGPMVGFPMFTNVGRLNQSVADSAGRAYAEVIRKLNPGKRVVLDKLPLNFLNLGLIQKIVPGAKVIHCRRAALDSCLSCYFQLFDGHLPFAYTLEGVGHFYREYERLMAHWCRVLSIPMLPVDYEDLVANQERASRTIYEFVGIPWTDDALKFHQSKRTSLTSSNTQVRQPIYSRSVNRSRNYEAHLGPLRAALGMA